MTVKIVDEISHVKVGYIDDEGYPHAETPELREALNKTLGGNGEIVTLDPDPSDHHNAYTQRVLEPGDDGYLQALHDHLPTPFGLDRRITTVVNDPEPTEKSDPIHKELLEIREHCRIWVRSPDDVPEGREARYVEEGDEAGNQWFYEVPFTTETTIDIGDLDVDATTAAKRLTDRDQSSDFDRNALVKMGVPERDLYIYDALADKMDMGQQALAKTDISLSQVQSPATLLSLYQTAYEADDFQKGAFPAIRNELSLRGVEAVERVAKARRYFETVHGDVDSSTFDKSWQPYEGPQGGEGWYNPETDEVRYQEGKPDESSGETDDGGTDSHTRPTEMSRVPVGSIDDFEEGLTLEFGLGDDAVQLDVTEVHDDPTSLMGPNAGYAVLEDGTATNLTGDRFEEGVIPEEYELRALTDADAVVETEVYEDPAGSPDPNEWDIRWQGVTREGVPPEEADRHADRDLLRLDPDEKDQFYKEWKAAAPDDGVEKVWDSFQRLKATTMGTGAQFLDKVMMESAGIEGEPRQPTEERDFDDAEDPSPEDIEAAKVFTAASRKFMAENFGEEFTLHRGLGNHVVEDLYDVLIDRFQTDSTEEVVMRDNPVATWTTDDKLAENFDKGIVARKDFQLEDVLSTPEALIDYDVPQAMTDWNEGEVNVSGWDMETTLDDLYVSDSNTTFRELITDPIKAELTDETNTSPLQKFAYGIRNQNRPEAARQLKHQIKGSDAYTEYPEEFEDALDVLEEVVDNEAKAVTVSDSNVIDIRADTDWMREARHEDVDKARVYVSDPSEVPDDYEVHEGERGGLYYETEGTSEGQARFGRVPPENEDESTLADDRSIPDDELVSGDLETDIEIAAVEGTEADVDAALDAYGAHYQTTANGADYYSTVHDDEWYVIERGDSYAVAEPFNEWLYDQDAGDFLDYDMAEEFNTEFWQNESEVYHATEPENAAQILVDGALETRNQTRGFGNQSVGRAVFTTRNSPMDIYGNATLEIDVEEMKEDGFTPFAEQEPEIREAREREAVASELGIEDFWVEYPQDVTADTTIFHEDIPFEYISIKASDETMEEIATEVQQMVDEGEVPENRGERVIQWLETNMHKADVSLGKLARENR